MTTWHRAQGPTPNLSADPLDHLPPHHDPPSKRDFNDAMLVVCRRVLDEARGRLLEDRNRRRYTVPVPPVPYHDGETP